jgi:uncharacterized membrane protein (DUF485 family)
MKQFYLNTYPIISVVIFYIMYLVMIVFQVILLSEQFEHVSIHYPGWKIVWVVTLLILPWMLSLIVKHRCLSKLEKTDENAEIDVYKNILSGQIRFAGYITLIAGFVITFVISAILRSSYNMHNDDFTGNILSYLLIFCLLPLIVLFLSGASRNYA